jgi:hypothetical protein
MTKDLTIKREKFCQEYVTNGGNASKAYRAAFNAGNMKHESVNVKASELLKDGKITVRVAELREEIAKRYQMTRDKMTEKLLIVMEQAELKKKKTSKKIEDPDLLRRSAMDMAKLHGLIVDKKESVGALTFVKMDNVQIGGKPIKWDIGEEVKPEQ